MRETTAEIVERMKWALSWRDDAGRRLLRPIIRIDDPILGAYVVSENPAGLSAEELGHTVALHNRGLGP